MENNFKNGQNEEKCCVETGQINIFGNVENNTKSKEETKKETKKTATKKFEEVEKHKIIYAGHEIEIQPEHFLSNEETIWEIYLKDRFPEFRAGKEYVHFSLGEKDQEDIIFPRPKAYKMG